jgi:biopolymer transport protein ExbB/TolQ
MMLKFFTGLSLKTWLIIAAVIAALVAIGIYQHRGEQVTELKGTVKEQAGTIASQQATIAVDAKVDALQEQTQVETQQATQQATRKHEAIQRQNQNVHDTIEQKYDSLPVTVDNVNKRHQEMATNQYNALWAAYCQTKPSDPQCQTFLKR